MADKQKNLEDDIPSGYLAKFDTISKESWKHEDFRKRILDICKEHQDSKDFALDVKAVFIDLLGNEVFINKVQVLAQKETKDYVDKTRMGTFFWILGLIITAAIGIIIQKFFKIF